MDSFWHYLHMWRGVIWRAALMGLVWWFFPWWIFACVAGVLYFLRWIHAKRLFALFIGILLVAAFLPHSFFEVIFIILLFFFLFGVKDLIFVERETAYEVLFLTIFLAASIYGFYRLEQWKSPWEFIILTLLPILFYAIGRGMLHYIEIFGENALERNFMSSGVAILALIVWEFSIVVLFLPIHFLYQAVILFSFSYAALELALFEAHKKPTHTLVFAYSAFFAVVFVITLVASEWRF